MRAENADVVNCPSCGATLIAGLRFCRMCGYRLGEGLDEYVPTQRLDSSQQPFAPAQQAATDPFAQRQTWGAAPMQPVQPFGSLNHMDGTTSSLWAKTRAPKRGGWWLWVTIAIVLLVAGGMVPLSLMRRAGGRVSGPPPIVKSFMGVDGFETAPGGGALITGIAAPDTPVVRAGLIGGDVIKTFDGKEVRDDDAMRELLASTPAGKTVPVIAVRDGVQFETTMTTIAARDNPGLKVFDRRPGGAGNLEIDRGDLERVAVPGMSIYGVELGDLDRNGPADIAGLRKGDIVIKFGEYIIRTPGDLRYRIAEATPGSDVPVTVVRGTEQMEIRVKVGRSKD